jgi:uncharacterized membrane protein
MNRIGRMLRHRWRDQTDLRRALPADALSRLTERVASSERQHSGEIRICIEAGLPWSYLWKRLPARARALMMFGKLRVWDTEHNNGVLIYLLLAEHTIEIVADRGLNPHASAAQWAAILERMKPDLRAGSFEAGLNTAVDAVDELLHAHFARQAQDADVNELPDAPLVI